MDRAETVEQIEAELPPPSASEQAEAAYQAFVEKNLPRNFAGHFIHGMLGMTGFRIFNAPTFLPAYLHLITRALPGSDFWVASGARCRTWAPWSRRWSAPRRSSTASACCRYRC